MANWEPFFPLLSQTIDRQQSRKLQNAEAEDDLKWKREQRIRSNQVQGEEDSYTAEMRAAAAPAVRTDMAMPATMDNRDVGAPGEPLLGPRLNGRMVTDPAAANADEAAYNTPQATMRRQADVATKRGRGLDGAKLRDLAKSMEEEDILGFLDAQKPMLPSLEEVKAGKTSFPVVGVEGFNSRGTGRLPPGTQGKVKIVKLPDGRETLDFQLVDKDGEVVKGQTGLPMLSARNIENLHAFTRAELAKQDAEGYKTGKTIEHQGRADAVAERGAAVGERNAASIEKGRINTNAYQMGMLGVAQQNADTNEAYREDSIEVARNKPPKSAYERMPEADRMQVAAFDKQIGAAAELKMKGMADGTWDPEKPTPAQQQILRDARAAERRKQIIMERAGAAGGAPGDPLGLRQNVIPPQVQQQRDVESGLLMIRGEYGGDIERANRAADVLRNEAKNAKGELRTILEGNIQRLELGIRAAQQAQQGQQAPQPQVPQPGAPQFMGPPMRTPGPESGVAGGPPMAQMAPEPAAPPQFAPDSPYARAQQVRAAQAQQQQVAQQEAVVQADAAGRMALQKKDKAAAYKVMQMPGFALLDRQAQMLISNLVNGR